MRRDTPHSSHVPGDTDKWADTDSIMYGWLALVNKLILNWTRSFHIKQGRYYESQVSSILQSLDLINGVWPDD